MTILIIVIILVCIGLILYIRFTTSLDRYVQSRPKIVFRKAVRPNIPKDQLEATHYEWLRLNPEYSMIWYDDKMCDDFMREHYPGRIENAYRKLKPIAFKIDLWRLCVLNLYGGVYIDAFAKPFKPFSFMFEGCEEMFVAVLDPPNTGFGVHNGFIASRPNHPFLKQGIEDITKNVEKGYYGHGALDVTGPVCLRKTIQSITGKTPCVGINNGMYPYFLFKLTPETNQNVFKGHIKIFCKYFDIGFKKRWKDEKGKSNYLDMWQKRDIYN